MAYDTTEDIAFVRMPNGREFVLAAFSNSYVAPYTADPYPYDANILGGFCELLTERLGLTANNPAKLVLDNAAVGFSVTGSWATGSSATDKYGADYRYKTADGTGTATWNLSAPSAGRYEVCVWYPQGTNRAADAAYTVNHAGGSTTVHVNQRLVGGRWFRLGDFQLAQGGGSVVLAATGADATKLVVADAIRAIMWPTNTAVGEWENY